MDKKFLTLAAVAAMFAACSNDADPVQEAEIAKATEVSKVPVGFDIYLNRATTRSGTAGEITTASIQTGDHKNDGFGVFGFYTDNNDYDQMATPNFMYNQQVKYVGSKWVYEPVKYWPNEYGSKAASDDADKVSFFAYAPYVAVTPSTGKVEDATSGIAGMTRNSATGDPFIKYVVSLDPTKSVDLLWGTVANGAESWSVFDNGNGTTQTMIVGKPWLDVQRPSGAVDQKMKFDFKHALAKLNVDIDAFVDGTNNTNALADGTKIYVRSITFEGLAMKGALNLNNGVADKAQWMDFGGINDLEGGEVTIFDGRKDGKEGFMGAVASNEKNTGLNPVIISNDENTTAGVTKDAVNLFAGATDATSPVYVIPTSEDVNVTIVYDVETADANLAKYLSDGKTPGSSIENKISKENVFGATVKLENGKAYTLHIHLGMNSVKLDAVVSDWVNGVEENTYLPSNN